MRTTISPARYSSAAIILHWALAALLLFQLSLGWRLEDLAGLPQYAAYQLHKTIGISILLLSVARLILRIVVPRPRTANTSPLLAMLAGAVHALLYVVMIGGPITGWIIVSTAKIKVQTMLFGVIPWPHLPVGAGWHDPAEALHSLIAWMFVGLFVLHVAGALRHHLQRQDLIGRMVPRAMSSRGALNIVVVLALLGCAGAFLLARVMPFGAAPSAPPQDALANASNAVLADNAANIASANEMVAPIVNAAEAVENSIAPAEATQPPAQWRVQSGGKLGFKADYSGSAIDGAFTGWNADILFSPDDLPNSRISVTVDLASVDSADSQRDDTLRSDSFFNVASHPRATFRSTSITHRGGKAYRAAGTLSLHAQQRPVTLSFTLDIQGDQAKVAGSAPLSRTAFGVGTGEWADTGTVADAVSVTFNFTAQRQK